MQVNDTVKWLNPLSAAEQTERFTVLELRGDRVLVEFICDMPIRPTSESIANLYRSMLAAEDAWIIEMSKVTTTRIGDFRYTKAASGLPGTPLRAAYDAFVARGNAWRAAAWPNQSNVAC